MSRRLIAVAAVAGTAVAAMAAVLPVIIPAEPLPPERIARHVAIGVAWIAAGLVALWRRPANRIGMLMAAVGFLWFLPNLDWWHAPAAYILVRFFGDLYLAVAVQMVLAFPSGRLPSRVERAVVVAAYADALVVANLGEPFRDPLLEGCSDCPHNPVLVHASKPLAEYPDLVGTIVGAVLAAALVALLLLRWRQATAPARRVLAPVLWSGALVAALQVALAIQPDPDEGTPLGVAAGIAFGAFPLAFLAGLVNTRLHRGAIAQLVIELGAAPSPSDVRAPLSRTLGDPSLDVAFSVPSEDRYVDPDGETVELPTADPTRAVTVLEHASRPVAALIHDPSLREDPTLLDAVGAATVLTLENARLQAELHAQLAEVRASRARILAAGDEERRRIERDLHDGAQQRLLATRLALQLVRDRTAQGDAEIEALLGEADGEVQGALEEIRALARGLHPAILSEDGLAAALAALARRSPIPVEITALPAGRLPADIERAAYFLAAEAIANAAKHAGASRVRVGVQRSDGQAVVLVDDDGVGGARLTSDGGLNGLRDRIEALGGRFALTSEPGAGTELRAEIPCA